MAGITVFRLRSSCVVSMESLMGFLPMSDRELSCFRIVSSVPQEVGLVR